MAEDEASIPAGSRPNCGMPRHLLRHIQGRGETGDDYDSK
jgi:hypothetical protein